jgi:uncharacterized protein (TIGR03086 family)
VGSPHASDEFEVLLERHRRAATRFARVVGQVRADQWSAPTPCTDWEVRRLVNHVVGWNLFVAELLEGRTPVEVLELIQRDVLGEDPSAAALASAERAIAAFGATGALERVVHHPVGDLPGTYVVMMRVFDNTLHGWDLARAIGSKELMDPDLTEAVYEWTLPQREAMHASGAFAPEPPIPADADVQTRLLALVGRKA